MIKAIIFDFHDTVIIDGFSIIVGREGRKLKRKTWEPFWRGKISEDEFWQKTTIDFKQSEEWRKRSRTEYYTLSVSVEGILFKDKINLSKNFKNTRLYHKLK